MPRFNPFGKALPDLLPPDLAALREVSEGWHIEYKETVPNATGIAKSISAFSNHYGGWLFYGIQASRDGKNVAAAFPGVPNLELPATQRRISDAAARNVNPPPVFETRVLSGPEPGLPLDDGRSVLVVLVPQGSDPPYIHASGRIYRRVGDQSEPRPETDRAVLDLLWSRGQKTRERLAAFLASAPELSQAEERLSILSLFLLPDVFGERAFRSALTLSDFSRIMCEGRTRSVDFACDNFFSASDSYYARQVASNDPYVQTLTWRHYLDGSSVVTVPLRALNLMTAARHSHVEQYEHWASFQRVAEEQGLRTSDVLDLNLILALAAGMVGKQQRLLATGGIRSSVSVKARISGAWRRVPFVDTPQFIDRIKAFRIPLIQENEFYVPAGLGPENFEEISHEELCADDRLMANTYGIWGGLLSAFGLEGLVSDKDSIARFLEAAQRGMKAHSGVGSDGH